MADIDLKSITCGVCGIRHDGGPSGFGPCPKGHTMADEVKKLTFTNKSNRKTKQ